MLTPTTWSELTPEQVYTIAPLILSDASIANQYAVLEALCDASILPAIDELTEEQLAELLAAEEIEAWWHTPIDEPIIPIIEHNGVAYRLPNAKFRCMVMVEYDFLETYYHIMTATGVYDGAAPQPEMIIQLIATMCRPQRPQAELMAADYNGEPRERFNPEWIATRAAAMHLLPVGIQAYILLFFIGCRNAIADTYPILFSREPKKETENRLEKWRDRPKSPYGWKGVMFDLAETGLFGNFLSTQFTSMHTILYYLQKKKQEAKEAEKP